MTSSYRIEYTEIKPGGAEDRQCELVRGSRGDVVIHLTELTANVKPGSIEVFETNGSDGISVSIGNLGFND